VYPKLVANVLNVGINGPLTQDELLCDLAVGQSASHQRRYFALTRGQLAGLPANAPCGRRLRRRGL
jgi:hypothetical protein